MVEKHDDPPGPRNRNMGKSATVGATCGASLGLIGVVAVLPIFMRVFLGLALLGPLLLGILGAMTGMLYANPRPGKWTLILKWAAIGMACGAAGGFTFVGLFLAGFDPSLRGGGTTKPPFNLEAGGGGAICLGLAGAVAGSLYGIVSGLRRK